MRTTVVSGSKIAFVAGVPLLLAAVVTGLTAAAAHAAACALPITSPKAGTTWDAGSIQDVTWDLAALPPDHRNHTGLLLLGRKAPDGTTDLDIKHPLASMFPLNHGEVSVTVPAKLQAGTNYIVELLCDSGTQSPEFTIRPYGS